MPMKFKIFAIAAALAAGTSSAAISRDGISGIDEFSPPVCWAGWIWNSNGFCQRVATTPAGYGNPVTGTVSGEEAGAANGSRPPAAGPCAAGSVYSLGYCYPAH
jgi:hypothetical protein